MPKFHVTSPEGKTYEVNAPEGATQDQAVKYVQDNMASLHPVEAKTKPALPPGAHTMEQVNTPGFESGQRRQNFIAGVKTALAGIPAGIAQASLDQTRPQPVEQDPSILTSMGNAFSTAMDYANPATMIKRAVAMPIRAFGGEDAVQSFAQNNAMDAAALAKKKGGLAGQVAPALALAPLTKGFGSGYAANALLGSAFGAGQTVSGETSEDRAQQRETNALLGAVGGAGGTLAGNTLARAGRVVKGSYNALRNAAGSLANDVTSAPATQEAAAKAAAEAARNTTINVRVFMKQAGIDYDKLSKAGKLEAEAVVRRALDAGTPETAAAATRDLTLKSLRVPIKGTRGQITQDFEQAIKERILADSGATELRKVMDAQSAAVAENITATGRAAGGKNMTKERAGAQVRDTFGRLYDAEKAKTKALYKAADEQEGAKPITLGADAISYLQQRKGFEGIKGVVSQAKELGLIKTGKDGVLIASAAPAKNLYELRRTLSGMQKGNDSAGHMAGEIKQMVDGAFENVGPMYKQAAAQRRQQALKYEIPDALQKIYGTRKGGQEVKVADEKLVEALQKSTSIDDLRTIKRTLLSNKEAVGHREAAQLWQDMRKQALDRITQKAVQVNDKTTTVSHFQLKKALDDFGDERLRLVFGPKAAHELRQIQKAAQILFEQPKQKLAGSQTTTYTRLMNMGGIAGFIDKIPAVGVTARIAKGAGKVAYEAGKRNIDAAAAIAPTENVIGDMATKEARQKQLQTVLRTLPPSTARRFMAQLGAMAAASGNSSKPAEESEE